MILSHNSGFRRTRKSNYGKPPCLKAFLDLSLVLSTVRYDVDRFVWMDNWRSFVSVGDEDDDVPDPVLDYKARVDLCLEKYDLRTNSIIITIFSTSRQAAMSCLGFLDGLLDSYFKGLTLGCALDGDDENGICPFYQVDQQGQTLHSLLVDLCGSMLFGTVSQSDKTEIWVTLILGR
jgi:hypothetical protein